MAPSLRSGDEFEILAGFFQKEESFFFFFMSNKERVRILSELAISDFWARPRQGTYEEAKRRAGVDNKDINTWEKKKKGRRKEAESHMVAGDTQASEELTDSTENWPP